MADVSFNEEPISRSAPAPTRSLFMKLAYATGIPKNDTQAQYVLLGVLGIAFALMVWLLVPSFSSSRPVDSGFVEGQSVLVSPPQ